MPPKRKARKCAAAIDLTDDASPEKKQKVALTTIAKEFVCPITQELPISPVTAEDGKIYEEKDILHWFAAKLENDESPTSPATGAVIGPKLLPAPQVRNTIEALVKSGAIEGDLATAWTKKLKLEKEMEKLRAQAEGGDTGAMYRLGIWYQEGNLTKDDVLARSWFGRSAMARNPRGMASFAECLLLGIGGPQNDSLGLVIVTEAAGLGSDLAMYTLGEALFKGDCGLPKDYARARFWLKKAVDGKCKHKHLNPLGKAEAAEWLRQLDQEA